MRARAWTVLLAVLLVWIVPCAWADVWDQGPAASNDNGPWTENELVHGLEQTHDLGAQGSLQDEDWYHVHVSWETSWEVVLDSVSGELSNANQGASDLRPLLQLVNADSQVFGTSDPITGFGAARSLRYWRSGLQSGDQSYYVLVSQPACGNGCSANSRYRIRFYDTTLLLSRFNNTATQVTVLILQNATDRAVSAYMRAYEADGTLLLHYPIDLAPHAIGTFNLATYAGGALNGKAGGLVIVHDAPYGKLAGKGVALEPATGFTFDTPLVQRPH